LKLSSKVPLRIVEDAVLLLRLGEVPVRLAVGASLRGRGHPSSTLGAVSCPPCVSRWRYTHIGHQVEQCIDRPTAGEREEETTRERVSERAGAGIEGVEVFSASGRAKARARASEQARPPRA
jgi:hypothetical protein